MQKLSEMTLWRLAFAGLFLAWLSTARAQSPVITTNPVSQTVLLGTNVTFRVAATGQGPLSYQWLFNSFPIPGATNTSLILTNVQCASGGNYSAIVTNQLNSATSSNA